MQFSLFGHGPYYPGARKVAFIWTGNALPEANGTISNQFILLQIKKTRCTEYMALDSCTETVIQVTPLTCSDLAEAAVMSSKQWRVVGATC